MVLERLTHAFSHHVLTLLLNEELQLAPIKPDIQVRAVRFLIRRSAFTDSYDQKVVDIGTGTGELTSTVQVP